MSYKVMLLLKPHIRKYCEEILGNTYDGMELTYKEYEELKNVFPVFLKEKKQYDGFITSGYIPLISLKHFIEAGEEIPIVSFDIEVEHIYQLLLKQLLLNEQTDVNRIGIDFLENGYTLRQALTEERLPDMAEHFRKVLTESLPDKVEEKEAQLLQMYENRLKRNELDLILTQFHSVLLLGDSYGVDSHYINPSMNELNRTLLSLRHQIDSIRMKENLSGAILVLPKERDTWHLANEEREHFLLELKKNLMSLNSQYLNSLVLKEIYCGYEIYANSMLIKMLTDNYSICTIQAQLKQSINFDGVISYGIGTTLNHARLNAWEAAAYGKKVFGKDHGSFLMDEKESVFLLDASQKDKAALPAESSKYFKNVASNVRLSVETISKLASMIRLEGSNEVTAAQIIKSLNISPRTASKILNNLQKYGYAEMIGQENLGGKGRPVKHYRLKFKV